MKRLRIGRRRARVERSSSPLELALAPALVEGRWHVPDRFNFTRDVVEALAEDPKRRALTFSGVDGIIEPVTFRHVADGAARWATLLRERGVKPGDRVLVLVGSSAEWLEIVLGCVKVGAVTVPGSPGTPAPTLEVLVAATGASLVVADHASDRELAQMSFELEIQYLDEAALVDSPGAPTHDTSSRDVAFIVPSSGATGDPRPVAHTHGSTFAARVQAEHWLDATRGDAVWCTADTGVAQRMWSGLFGPWSRGAELVLHDGGFDSQERLDLIHRLSVTILCQTPVEYRALSEVRRRDLERYRPRRLRRLVSTGDYLEPDVVAVFEEAWGMTIHDGYGQAETNVVVANGADEGFRPGSLGRALPGHHVAVVDGQGNELPPGIEGDLVVRGRPPTLFTGYWDQPDETKAAFSGDSYVTGDVAARDEDGFFWFVGRSADVIAARGRTFGPHEVEKVLREHAGVRNAAVVGVRDLERGGHFVRAFVVLGPRTVASEQLEAELRQHVADLLPEHQVPREVEFVDSLPTSPSGKIRRDALRERAVERRPLWETASEPVAPAATATAAPAPVPVEPPTPVEAAPEPPAFELEPEPQTAAEASYETYPAEIVDVGGSEVVTEPPFEHVPEVAAPATLPLEFAPSEAVVEAFEADTEPVSEPPAAMEPELEHVLEPAVEHVVEPVEPVAEVEPVVEPPAIEEPELVAAADPAPLPDFVVEPAPDPAPPTVLEPEPPLEPAPDDEPLPDYIVDPSRPAPPEPVPAPAPARELHPEPEPPRPVEEERPLAGLGIKPVTEFPRRESSPGPDSPPRRRRPAARAESNEDRNRSLGDPGDEPEEVGWMQGLSSRLSAYSLGEDAAQPERAEDTQDEDERGKEPEAPDEA